jgi:hypothetical protein
VRPTTNEDKVQLISFVENLGSALTSYHLPDVITIRTAQELVDAPVTQEKIWQAMQTVA